MCKGGWCERSANTGRVVQLSAIKPSSVENCKTTPRTANVIGSPCMSCLMGAREAGEWFTYCPGGGALKMAAS
ncbi:MAG: hypothetical protein SOT10_05195 [Oscillospiraceae bacterium]|nr:hypothetical protein [Oscillospiraceae bacterium]